MMMEWMGGAFLVGALILAGLLAAAIYVGVRAGLGWNRHSADAQQTLDRRFAAGEIDDGEYHERLAVLGSVQAGKQIGSGLKSRAKGGNDRFKASRRAWHMPGSIQERRRKAIHQLTKAR